VAVGARILLLLLLLLVLALPALPAPHLLLPVRGATPPRVLRLFTLVRENAGGELELEEDLLELEAEDLALVVDLRIGEAQLVLLDRLMDFHRQPLRQRLMIEQGTLLRLGRIHQVVARSLARPVAVPEAVGLSDPVGRDRSAVDTLPQIVRGIELCLLVVRSHELPFLAGEQRRCEQEGGDPQNGDDLAHDSLAGVVADPVSLDRDGYGVRRGRAQDR